MLWNRSSKQRNQVPGSNKTKVSGPGSSHPGLMYLCIYVYFSMCGVLFSLLFPLISPYVLPDDLGRLRDRNPGSVRALEAATPASLHTQQLQQIVKGAVFKSVPELWSALDP